jgi:hypothetical protein
MEATTLRDHEGFSMTPWRILQDQGLFAQEFSFTSDKLTRLPLIAPAL